MLPILRSGRRENPRGSLGKERKGDGRKDECVDSEGDQSLPETHSKLDFEQAKELLQHLITFLKSDLPVQALPQILVLQFLGRLGRFGITGQLSCPAKHILICSSHILAQIKWRGPHDCRQSCIAGHTHGFRDHYQPRGNREGDQSGTPQSARSGGYIAP